MTCFSEHSRNQRAGLYIGQGETVEEALRHVGAAVEGYYAADSIEHLARELRIDMPICSAIYRVLYKGHSAAKEIAPLMRRAGFSEFRQSNRAPAYRGAVCILIGVDDRLRGRLVAL